MVNEPGADPGTAPATGSGAALATGSGAAPGGELTERREDGARGESREDGDTRESGESREGGDTRESGETRQERLNRNWADVLQELRVIQAGSQIITGFLLAAAFQPRFADLDTTGRVIYFSLLGVATATTIVGLTPVLLHRWLFGIGAKAWLVVLGGRLAAIALVGVGITLAGIVLLIVDVVAGLELGLVAAGFVLLVIAGLWLLLPSVVQRRIRRPD